MQSIPQETLIVDRIRLAEGSPHRGSRQHFLIIEPTKGPNIVVPIDNKLYAILATKITLARLPIHSRTHA